MVLPTIAGLIILNFYPLCRTVYMSFFQSGSFGKWTFVGLNNYLRMFQSAGFWKVTGNTLLFMLYTVPVTVMIGLFIAVMLDQNIGGKSVFRAIYFLPMVVAPAAVAMVWKWLFNKDFGIINLMLQALHLPADINWISDPKTALAACAVVTVWSSVGYDAILLLSGLQGISRTYYEAARIDGATPFQQFMKITLPLVSPTLFFVLIMRIMASLKVFDIVYMMIEKTNPAIRNCETILYNFYQETFVKNNKGYGASLVVWCVILISIITAIQFIGQRKWVTYDV
ncbi:sugar ABC transporter permease [Lachnospiraceae bacterium 54-53]